MSKNISLSKTLVWILMGLLIFGLGGFGITNLGGNVQTVGSVNGKSVEVDQYYRALQQQLSAFEAQTGQRIGIAQAQQFGLDQQVLSQLLNERALDAEAERLGLSMGDENLREQILSIAAFQGLDGNFDRDAYRFALQNSGQNESEFEDSLREDAARSLLQGAVVAGVEMPDTYAQTLISYLGEQRSFSIATLNETHLDTPIAVAEDAELRRYYDENTDAFMRPATREITYAWLTPAMLIDSVEVDDAALRAEYDARDAEFNQPERRLVERLVFGDDAEATAAIEAVNAGDQSFETLVEARGLQLSDVDMGDVTLASLGAASEAVFAAEVGAVVGPLPTDLGPALFRVNGVLEAQNTSFEDAMPMLRDALAADRARRVIDAQINDVDDLLAGGATLEELAQETDLVLDSLSYHAGLNTGIAGYADFQNVAQQVTDSDFPQIETLEDGSIYALRLEGETEAAPAPFDEVKDAVAAAWRNDALIAALNAKAETLLAKMAAGADIVTLGLVVVQETDVTRGSFVPDTPQDFLQTVFEMTLGEEQSLAFDDQVLIVELDAITAADDQSDENNALLTIIGQQVSQALAQDIFQAFGRSIMSNADIEVDQHALNAVHAQLP
ncbi:peptidyl-prolyl cis-trans isomerase [Cognatishimia sp. WU-CL00825]|uniref:SurA N-terminal domain-containing protein n=1 Tax=Cognatishimia sp. WU-CL00825 TaxID=3127658 RepID=UPI00310BC44A